MDAVIQWIVNNPAMAVIIADAVAGIIPDKYLSYVGGIRELVNALYKLINK